MFLFHRPVLLALSWAVAGPASAGANPAQPPADLSYRSAFERYQRHADPPMQPWRQANDEVGRIGGWQAYAREVHGGKAASATAEPPPLAASGPEHPRRPPGHRQ